MEESCELKGGGDVESRKLEFIGWGSKPLIDFLESIGKNTGRNLGQYLVTAIINDYINANNLTNPIKKKEVICDEKLQALFGKISLPRPRIFHLLDPHFAINQKKTYGVAVKISSTVENTSLSKREGSCQKDKVLEIYKCDFAAVVQHNIKLVYLTKTLVKNLAKIPELFEEKLIGSFVRIKSDTGHHQLHQVLGVKMSSKIHLQLSNCKHDVPIDDLSDENFSQCECEDLWRRIKDGSLKRPTIMELEVKAKMLHEDITSHDIQRDLQCLKNRIAEADANAKGWRSISQRCRNERNVLEDPSEQKKRLSRIPHVLPDESGLEATPADAVVKEKGSISSPILIQSEPEPEAAAANATLRVEGNSSSPIIIQCEKEPEAAAANAIVKVDGNSSSPIIIQSEREPKAAAANGTVRKEGNSSSPIIIVCETEPEAAAVNATVRIEGNSSSPIIIQCETEPGATVADAITKKAGHPLSDWTDSGTGQSLPEHKNDSSIIIYQEIPIDADWCIDLSKYGALPDYPPTSEVPQTNSTEVLTEAAPPPVQKRDSLEILAKAAASEDHRTTKASSSTAKRIPLASTSKSLFKTQGKRARQ